MKIRSTKALPYDADRSGIKRGIIEIDLTIISRDDVRKTYTLKATDHVILPEGETSAANMAFPAGMTNKLYIAEKLYVKSYEEYDQQREYLKAQDTSGLTGSALDDKLLQDALLYSAMTDTIYESTATNWKAYNEPVVVITVPVIDESDGKIIAGEAGANDTVKLTIEQGTTVTDVNIIAGPSGQFAYMPYPVLLKDTKVSAVATNITGLISAKSNVIVVSTPEEPVIATEPETPTE